MTHQPKETILLVHYHYPPMRNSGVYRNYFLSHAFAAAGMQVRILTTSNVFRLPAEELPPHPSITIQTIPTFDYRTLASFFSTKKKQGAQFSETTKKGKLVRFFMKMQRSFPFHLLLGEGGLVYIIAGFLAAKKSIRQHNIQKVYTSFMPYADHWIGWLLKKSMPQVQWIADFRDLHAEPIYKNIIWPGLQCRFEKTILRQATLLTAVSDGIASKLRNLHPHVITVTKGVDLRSPKPHYSKFTIAYTGSLFLEYRDPSPLFSALQHLLSTGMIDAQQIQFIYAGKDQQKMAYWVEKYKLEHIAVYAGFVSRNQAMEIQDKSHLNLLLTAATPEHAGLMTGKMFEYLEAGNPILCLIQGSFDAEIENMIKTLNAGYIVYDPPGNGITCEQILSSCYTAWKEDGQISSSVNIAILETDYTWQSRAKKMLDALG